MVFFFFSFFLLTIHRLLRCIQSADEVHAQVHAGRFVVKNSPVDDSFDDILYYFFLVIIAVVVVVAVFRGEFASAQNLRDAKYRQG